MLQYQFIVTALEIITHNKIVHFV